MPSILTTPALSPTLSCPLSQGLGFAFSVEHKRHLRSSLEAPQPSSSPSNSGSSLNHHRPHLLPSRYQRRALPACKELAFEHDGDQNGVLRYIGTLYGTQDWVNPVLTKRVEVRVGRGCCGTALSPSHTDSVSVAGNGFHPSCTLSRPPFPHSPSGACLQPHCASH